MAVLVRAATRDDIAAIRELARTHRHDYQRYQATFWRRAGASREEQTAYLESRLADAGVVAYVHLADDQVDGFVLASVIAAPPVYDPGGPVALVDAFALRDPDDWPTSGASLLRAAVSTAREKGAVLVAVVAGHDDTRLHALLERESFSLASEWHRRSLAPGRPISADVSGVRPAAVADLPALLDLAERRRVQYQGYQHVFWRNARDAQPRQRSFLERLLQSGSSVALVHARRARVDGFLIGNLVPSPAVFTSEQVTLLIDDFCVAHPADWSGAGLGLLQAASAEGSARGAAQIVVNSGHLDRPKRTMLNAAGFHVSSEWWVRAF